jgi:hypothetical protein
MTAVMVPPRKKPDRFRRIDRVLSPLPIPTVNERFVNSTETAEESGMEESAVTGGRWGEDEEAGWMEIV